MKQIQERPWNLFLFRSLLLIGDAILESPG